MTNLLLGALSETHRYQREDTELHREIARLKADHAEALRREEEKGYARGLRDARQETCV